MFLSFTWYTTVITKNGRADAEARIKTIINGYGSDIHCDLLETLADSEYVLKKEKVYDVTYRLDYVQIHY